MVHEANARAGLANRVGARLTPHVAAAVEGSGLRGAQVLGIPLRTAVARLDRAAARAEARAHFGLTDGPVLLVTGGSQGARNVNRAVTGAAADLAAAGVQVLHVAGPKQAEAVRGRRRPCRPTHVLPYVDRMELAYAAADLAVCRAGAMTCAELAAVGLPAVYVPLPIGNGEQALNARPVVDGGGGLLVDDAAFDPDVRPLDRAAAAARPGPAHRHGHRGRARLGHRDADEALVDLVLSAVRG